MLFYTAKEHSELTVYGAIVALKNKDTKRVDVPLDKFLDWANKNYNTCEQTIETILMKENIIMIMCWGAKKVILMTL